MVHACAAPSGSSLSSDEETAEEARVPVEDLGKENPGPDETSSEEVFSEVFSEFPLSEGLTGAGKGQFGTAQLDDANLEHARQNVVVVEGRRVEGVSQLVFPHFSVKKGLLYRVVKRDELIVDQLLVPKCYVPKVLYLAHSHLLGAHLGVEKTYDRILGRFYWPGVKRAVQDYCRSCRECQKTAPKVAYRNPLIPLPIIDTPFQKVAMDIVGPLPKSSRGHRYILQCWEGYFQNVFRYRIHAHKCNL